MAVEGENLGTAAIYLTVDTTSLDAGIAKAKTKLAGMSADAEKQYTAMTASQRKVAEGLVKQAELINKTSAERVAYNAQLKIGGALGDEIAAKAIANAQAIDAVQSNSALNAARLSESQLLKANQTLAAYAAQAEAARAAEAAQAEMAAAEDARFKKIAADAAAEVEARQAVTAAMADQARANAALAESRGIGTAVSTGGAAAQIAGGLDSATVQQQIADYAALDAIMGKKAATTEEVAAAEAALDRLQAAGMISNEQLADTFAALDVATAAETKSLQANSVAQVENAAATQLNSRTQYELGVLLGEAASGNISRIKRSVPALLNAMNLTQKIFSPVGLAIGGVTAALALFGIAIADREKELLAFNKALASTGDFVGTTGLELQGIAAEVGQSTGLYSDASAAVLAFAKSGDVLGSHLKEMATVAVNMAYLTGESVDSVAKELIKLQGDPTQAIVKMTGAMGLLTAAQYDQIVETQQTQGASAAAALAMKDLSDASDTARTNLVDNAGIIIRAWDGFKTTLSEIGRDLGSIGAKESVEEQIADQQARIKTINARSPFDYRGDDATKQKDLADANAKIAQLQLQQQSDAMFAAGQELGNQAKEAHDKALAGFLASTTQGDEGFVAKAKEINKERYEALVGIVDPVTRDKINAAADQQIRDAAKRLDSQYPHNPSTAHHADPAATALATFQSQVAGLTDRSLYVDGDAALTKYVDGVAKLNDEFDKAIAKHADLTKAQAAYDDGMKALNQTLSKNQAAQQAQVQEFTGSLNDQLAARKALIDVTLKTMTMAPQEAANYKQLAEVTAEATAKIAEFQKQHTLHPNAMSQDEYATELQALKNYWNDVIQYTKDSQGKFTNLQSNFFSGMNQGIAAFIEETNNKFKQGQQFAQDFTNGLSDAFTQFATGAESAKKAFGDFIDQLFADAIRVEANQLIAKLLSFGQSNAGSNITTGNYLDNSTYGGSSSGGSSSAGFFATLLSAFTSSGGKAGGGMVDAGHLYKVNEQGPELLTVGNVDYLMMGSQRGNVTPHDQSMSRMSPSITIVQHIQPTSTRRTAEQVAYATARKLRTAQARTA